MGWGSGKEKHAVPSPCVGMGACLPVLRRKQEPNWEQAKHLCGSTTLQRSLAVACFAPEINLLWSTAIKEQPGSSIPHCVEQDFHSHHFRIYLLQKRKERIIIWNISTCKILNNAIYFIVSLLSPKGRSFSPSSGELCITLGSAVPSSCSTLAPMCQPLCAASHTSIMEHFPVLHHWDGIMAISLLLAVGLSWYHTARAGFVMGNGFSGNDYKLSGVWWCLFECTVCINAQPAHTGFVLGFGFIEREKKWGSESNWNLYSSYFSVGGNGKIWAYLLEHISHMKRWWLWAWARFECGLGSEVLKPTVLRGLWVRGISFCDSGLISSIRNAKTLLKVKGCPGT